MWCPSGSPLLSFPNPNSKIPNCLGGLPHARDPDHPRLRAGRPCHRTAGADTMPGRVPRGGRHVLRRLRAHEHHASLARHHDDGRAHARARRHRQPLRAFEGAPSPHGDPGRHGYSLRGVRGDPISREALRLQDRPSRSVLQPAVQPPEQEASPEAGAEGDAARGGAHGGWGPALDPRPRNGRCLLLAPPLRYAHGLPGGGQVAVLRRPREARRP
jgi:hypothetical protein